MPLANFSRCPAPWISWPGTGRLVYVGITTQEISFVTRPHRKEQIDLHRKCPACGFPRIIKLIENGVIDTDLDYSPPGIRRGGRAV